MAAGGIFRMCSGVLCGALLWAGVIGTVLADDDLRVLPVRDPKVKAPSPLYLHLQEAANAAIDKRRAEYEQIKTPEQVRAWQQSRREMFLKTLGGLPERTPLNAQISGRIEADGYVLEKVVFESRPGHHVTGNLYLPRTQAPYPGVILPCGHSFDGKASEGYQRASMLLALNGIAAFCYDPIGQGERYQTFGSDGKPLGTNYTPSPSSLQRLAGIPGGPRFDPVEEHTLMGIGSILVGTNTAQYRIHDGMRAIDYLVSRPEIDPQRIGCTGNSGGGTLTAYLMALDERIVCAAPTCYLTTFRRLLATSGPQDAEQNLFGQLADGLDEADYVLMRAPRPTLLCAGTRDATFDIAGTWDVYREGKRVFSRLGFPERIDVCEADEPHGFTRPLRIGAVRWMRRWLLQKDDAIDEPDLPVRSFAELQCTPTGQVMLLPRERSVFDLNREREQALEKERAALWGAGVERTARSSENLEAVRSLTGIRPAAELPAARVETIATVARDRYRIEKLVLHVEASPAIPALRFVPEKTTRGAVLYLHSSGKQADVAPAGAIEKLVNAGVVVMAIDLPGIGETEIRHPRDWGRELFGPNTQEFFVAYLLGKSLVGLRAEAVLQAARVLGTGGVSGGPVNVIAIGTPAAIPALHAAALEPGLVGELVLKRALDCWARIVDSPTAGRQLPNLVHAALRVYDLPDLCAMLGAGRIRIEEPVGADDQVLGSADAR